MEYNRDMTIERIKKEDETRAGKNGEPEVRAQKAGG
jgi:hypothetical protein